MDILITGATGFIGKHVVQYLNKLHPLHQITLARRQKPHQSLPYHHYVAFDLNEEQSYANVFRKNYDILIHLAWPAVHQYGSPVHLSQALPANKMFLRLAMDHCQSITVAGTCFEYGLVKGKVGENTACKPVTVYGEAKNRLREYLFNEPGRFQTNLQWLRIFYVYGPGQPESSLIPQLTTSIKRGDMSFNMSGGQQVLDYLPVEKLAEYIVEAALKKNKAGIYNCCSGKPVKLEDFVRNYIKEHFPGTDIRLNLGYYGYNPKEPMEFWGDNSKLKQLLDE